MVGSRTAIRGRVRHDFRIKSGPETCLEGVPVLNSVRDSLCNIKQLVDSTHHAMSEFIQMQKMASMEYLARGLAHDINSGLIILETEICMIEKTISQPEVAERITNIRKVTENLESLIQRLNMIGPEEVPTDLAHRDFSLEIKQVTDAMASSLKHNIHLHFLAYEFPLPVLLCQGDAWRILSNLMNNAQEAMPKGGDLLVGTYHREIGSDYCRKHGNARRGTFAMLSVCDHGAGMSPEMIDRIFDPLFSTKKGGMQHEGKHGWGLAIVYSLVRRRGGWIDVTSAMGDGTTFEVFLPLSTENRIRETAEHEN